MKFPRRYEITGFFDFDDDPVSLAQVQFPGISINKSAYIAALSVKNGAIASAISVQDGAIVSTITLIGE